MAKTYDRAYFDRWYRQGGIGDPRRLARKVALAVATAEYHLERPLRTVLDILRDDARELRVSSHYVLAEDGTAYRLVPEDRKRQGLFLEQSILRNAAIAALQPGRINPLARARDVVT